MDATCVPVKIKHPTDVEILDKARKKLENILNYKRKENQEKEKELPRQRTYKKKINKDFLNFAKKKNKNSKEIKRMKRIEINALKRLLGHIKYYEIDKKTNEEIKVIEKIIEQQEEMIKKGTRSVKERIVSPSMAFIRPIVRGKAKAKVEFGPKLEISVVDGKVRAEKISFEPYNEGTSLIEITEKFKTEYGYYPRRILADKIYRNRKNLEYCKEKGISLQGPKLGRPSKKTKEDRKDTMKDNVDRIEVERAFSELKNSYGLALVCQKLKKTIVNTILMAIFIRNLKKISYILKNMEFFLKENHIFYFFKIY